MKGLRFALALILMSATLNSCVKQNFDNPPSSAAYDPNLSVNLTIAQLSGIAENMLSGQYRTMGDSTIYGVVTADDRSGNFYKQIVIQDSTGGIVISIAQTYLYNDYPIGRKVYIKLKGLTLINYKGLPEVGFSASISNGSVSLTGIPSSLITNYVVKATYPVPVAPTPVTITGLFSNANKYLNMLVSIDNMEFDSLSANVPYAGTVSSGTIATSRTIRDCPYSGSMIMYNSAYATFQPVLTPSGKGTITGIFSIYITPQFLIRDTSDVKLTDNRDCQ